MASNNGGPGHTCDTSCAKKNILLSIHLSLHQFHDRSDQEWRAQQDLKLKALVSEMRAKDVDLLDKEYPEAPKGDKKDEQLTEQFLYGSPRFRAAYEDIKSSLSKQSFDHIIVSCSYPVVAEWLHKLVKHNKIKCAILDNKTTSVQRHTEISKHLKKPSMFCSGLSPSMPQSSPSSLFAPKSSVCTRGSMTTAIPTSSFAVQRRNRSYRFRSTICRGVRVDESVLGLEMRTKAAVGNCCMGRWHLIRFHTRA
jgi:hypothetical protein